ncbi:MAG: hypothetical protein NT142_10085 [Planctomycetota bacterium]|nr:hypothetical protein [Planctomycetota bacterium]
MIRIGSVIGLACLMMVGTSFSLLTAQDNAQKKAKNPEEGRKGTVTGLVTSKGDNWIEVKADGEEKGRKYFPHWVGGNPAQGGGPDKKMIAEIKKTPLKSRVSLEWLFEERPRVEKIELLSKPKTNGDKKDQ